MIAPGGYAGRLVTWAKTVLSQTIQIVKRSDSATVFQVLPRRSVMERAVHIAAIYTLLDGRPAPADQPPEISDTSLVSELT
ncbi:hypothetical protein [Nocardia africana]